MPASATKPPQLIPVGRFHRIRVDHDARTARLESTAAIVDLCSITPAELQKVQAEAERGAKFWSALGYAVTR